MGVLTTELFLAGRSRSADPEPGQSTSTTSVPRTCPPSLMRCASPICSSVKVCATGTLNRPADQRCDVLEGVDRPFGPGTAGHRRPGVLCPPNFGDRDDVVGPSRELHECQDRAATGGVERGVDAVGRDRADSLRQPLTIRGRFGAESAQVVVVARAGGADHPCAAGRASWTAELPTASAAPLTSRAARASVEQVQAASDGLDRHGQRGGSCEIERRRDWCVVGQQRQLGGGGAPDGKAGYEVSERRVGHAFAKLVDHAGESRPVVAGSSPSIGPPRSTFESIG